MDDCMNLLVKSSTYVQWWFTEDPLLCDDCQNPSRRQILFLQLLANDIYAPGDVMQ